VKTRSFVSVARTAALIPVALLIAFPGMTRVVVAHEHLAEPQSPPSAAQLSVHSAWARATPAGAGSGGAYFTILNAGKQTDTLVSLASPAAERVEMHRTVIENGLSRMRPAGQLVINPGQTLHVAPGGLHVMLTGLKKPLVAGTRLPLVLTFRQAGEITVQVSVRAPMEHSKP
jgi:periplasmic copper chaperone A